MADQVIAATWWHPERVVKRPSLADRVDDHKLLVELVAAGLTDAEIAQRLGRPGVCGVWRWRKKLGLTKPADSRKLFCLVINDTTCAILDAFRAEGLGARAIAERVGLSVGTVRRLQRHASAYRRRQAERG